MGKSRYGNWVVGRWLIESMDQWDRSFIDEDARGYCEFDASSSGSFAFGYVQGRLITAWAKGMEDPPLNSVGTAATR